MKSNPVPQIAAMILVMMIFTACGEEKDTTITENKSQNQIVERPGPGCYRMVIGRDTAIMELQLEGTAAKGKLLYQPFEKDRSEGEFTGSFESDTLNVWYTFQSEGLLSVRQVVMIPSEGGFAEGYGDLDMKGDTAYFKHVHVLNFEMKHLFRKTDCP